MAFQLANNNIVLPSKNDYVCEDDLLRLVIMAIKLGFKDWNSGLCEACQKGYVNIAKLMLVKGANDIIHGMYHACYSNDVNMIKFMISLGATEPSWSTLRFGTNKVNIEVCKLLLESYNYDHNEINDALVYACESENSDMINLVISYGANNFNQGLGIACEKGNINMINLMIEKGANDWDTGLFFACIENHLDIAKFMISKGIRVWNDMMLPACEGGNINIVKLIINHGANNFGYGITLISSILSNYDNEGGHPCSKQNYQQILELLKIYHIGMDLSSH